MTPVADIFMPRKKPGFFSPFCVAFLLFSAPVYAGDVDSKEADLSANIPGLIKISGFADIDLGTWTGAGGLTGSDAGCVWSSTMGYNLTATGSGPGGAFELADGANTLSFEVEWSDQVTGDQAVTSGVPLTGQVTTKSLLFCIFGGTNSSVEIIIPEASLAAASAGSYSGELNLLVATE